MVGRLLLSETLDPDGAMYRWLSADVAALGWDVLRVPTQTAVHVLGISGYQAWFAELAASFRPHVALVHPPYDYLGPSASARVREGGARLVGLAFDDAIFRPLLRATKRWKDAAAALDATFDLYAATDDEASERAAHEQLPRLRPIRWATSLDPLAAPGRPPLPEERLSRAAVLVGRASPRRVVLLRSAAPGMGDRYELHAFGHGWTGQEMPPGVCTHGPVTREEMVALYRGAAAIVTTGDWEDHAVAMTKYRVVETAMAGGYQLAQAAPDLRAYFEPREVPAWETVDDLRALLRDAVEHAARARATGDRAARRAREEHRWTRRWPELLGLLEEVGRPVAVRDDAEVASHPGTTTVTGYATVMAALAHVCEASGRLRAARELFEAIREREPDDHAALVGAGRCDYRLGDPAEAAARFARAAEREETLLTGAAAHLHARVPNEGRPAGLGRAGFLHPRAETLASLLAALLEGGRTDEALDRLETMTRDAELVVTVATLLDLPDELPESESAARFWSTLAERALAATPIQQIAVANADRPRWRAALDRWRAAKSAAASGARH